MATAQSISFLTLCFFPLTTPNLFANLLTLVWNRSRMQLLLTFPDYYNLSWSCIISCQDCCKHFLFRLLLPFHDVFYTQEEWSLKKVDQVMFLLYSKPLLVSLLTWNKSRVVAVLHQTLLDLDLSGTLPSFPTTLFLVASISVVLPRCWLWTQWALYHPRDFALAVPTTWNILLHIYAWFAPLHHPNKFLFIREDFLKLSLRLLVTVHLLT